MTQGIAEFQKAMAEHGLLCNEIIADAGIRRFHIEGDSLGTVNGWYLYHSNGIPAGAYGSWKTGEQFTWCGRKFSNMAEAERAEHKRIIEKAKAQQEAERNRQAETSMQTAKKIWDEATPAQGDHPYLIKKNIKPYGIKSANGKLLIPLCDNNGTLHSLQFIDSDGDKKFLKGGSVIAHYHLIGQPNGKIFLSEGGATAATIREATGEAVAVAFNAGNLLPVGKAIKEKYPDVQIIIAGDNDQWTDGNPGKTKAEAAGNELSAMVTFPEFKDTSTKPTDYNDLMKLEGFEVVRNQLLVAEVSKVDEMNSHKLTTEDEAAIAKLAAMPEFEYDRVRDTAAKSLGVRVSTLDAAVIPRRPTKESNNTTSGSTVLFNEPEPWPDPVNGCDLLNNLAELFKRYVTLPEGAAEAATLWILHTYTLEAVFTSPILAITSPQKRCGKTTLLSILGSLVFKPLPASNITAAALFRAVEKWGPTLLIDEADSFLRNSDELRGVLNSGHTRNTAFVIRTVGDENEPKTFSTWSPKAIALIGKLPGTLEDRALVISMRRKRPDETVEKLRADRLDSFHDMARKCSRWAADNLDTLKFADPKVPSCLNDRAADNWRPLLAIADIVGAGWSERARRIAEILSGDALEDDTAAVMLLEDIQELFKEKSTDRLPSSVIVENLTAMEERPWPEWRRGKPLTATQLSRLLKPFRIEPKQYKDGGEKHRGYFLKDFEDSFSRYIPVQTGTAGTGMNYKALEANQPGTGETMVPGNYGGNSLNNIEVPAVPDGKGVLPEGKGIKPDNRELFDL